jgi:hypothetical protein
MTKINLYVALATWRAFRMACVARGTSASKEVERLMREQLTAWRQANAASQ